MRAWLGFGELLLCAAALLWLAELWLARKKPHRLCGGNGCRVCRWTGKRYRSRVAGRMRRGK